MLLSWQTTWWKWLSKRLKVTVCFEGLILCDWSRLLLKKIPAKAFKASVEASKSIEVQLLLSLYCSLAAVFYKLVITASLYQVRFLFLLLLKEPSEPLTEPTLLISCTQPSLTNIVRIQTFQVGLSTCWSPTCSCSSVKVTGPTSRGLRGITARVERGPGVKQTAACAHSAGCCIQTPTFNCSLTLCSRWTESFSPAGGLFWTDVVDRSSC